jgi:hypothetical protein
MADQIIHERLLQRLILFTLQAFLVGLLDGLQTRPRKNPTEKCSSTDLQATVLKKRCSHL